MRTRKETIDRITGKDFDVCIIGGGASGLACALEAQLRGLSSVVIEAGTMPPGVPRPPRNWRTAVFAICRKPSTTSISISTTWLRRP